MTTNPLKQLPALGQSIWLDFIKRDLINSGNLNVLISEDNLRGVTSNPSIFEKSISNSDEYEKEINAMRKEDASVETIYEKLTQRDICDAADAFYDLYNQTNGKDGYVCLEVNPHLAYDTKGTISEARRLWKSLARPNILIKVPATVEGLPAIQQLISEGINVNITLLFGLSRYREVIDAYLSGLEIAVSKGESPSSIASVASFFLSRIDTLIDPLLEIIIAKGGENAILAKKLQGQVAISSAKVAYQIYHESIRSDRFKKLAEHKAQVQRLLWASTSTKNPAYSDIKYVDELIGPETINTLPLETLNAYRDHGDPKLRLENEIAHAYCVFEQLPKLGININQLTQQLENEGVDKFKKSFDQLIVTLEKKLNSETSENKTNTVSTKTLSPELLRRMNAYWRAANYLSVGQIYLYDNPLLKKPLKKSHVKPLVVGHWGTTPSQNFIYIHLNRAIKKYDLNMIYIAGPGHGGPALVGNTYLEGSYSEIYPEISRDEAGLKKLFTQFSFPGGISSHVAPTTPGSIHEGGELGYSLSHAFGAVFDNPSLIVACVIGDGEAETGPLATAWHSNKFLNPITDGAVFPILHLNGYKISNPTVLARIEPVELDQFLRGCGWIPYFVEGDVPEKMHELMATFVDKVIEDILKIQNDARNNNETLRPRWPMIVLKSPKGWTGPKMVDGLPVEGTFRAHQVPLLVDAEHPNHLKQLETWMKNYKPEELFDEKGMLLPELFELAPKGDRRMGANPYANGGLLLHDLRMPDFHIHQINVPFPGAVDAEDTLVLGRFLRDVIKLNQDQHNFRIFSPDETLSNLLGSIFEVTNRQWDAKKIEQDEFLAPSGRALDSMLSEHQCQGWLEGYLLTGRHGVFNSYEAFVRIVDSMFSQHVKWLKVTLELSWRRKIASLNYLLASHVWQQDHNGFTHQDPGFLDHVINKKADIVRIYLPPDANCLLSVFDHCLRSRHYVNVVVAGKHPLPQWLTMEEAVVHCTEGVGIWQWASNDQDAEPDIVMACCGDTPTLEILAAVSILRQHLTNLKIRVINVVDLMKLQPQSEHPHGLSDTDYDSLFTKDKHIIFGFHGYPWLIHRLTYRRNNRNLHVRGYNEEGTITTPFDLRVQNKLDRFNLVQDAIDRLPHLGSKGTYLKQIIQDKLIKHKQYVDKYGQDMPEIREWKWGG